MKPLNPPNLMQVFEQTDSHAYAVMKSLPTGAPEPGSDIDILCADAAFLGRQFLRNCRPLIGQGYQIRLRELPETGQVHIDLMSGDQIALRLDLHEGLGAYQRVPIKETFAQRILDRRHWAQVPCPSGVLRLPVPEPIDNLVLRYLEYHEWYDARPDKIKHANHIAEQLKQDAQTTRSFYDRLQQATRQRPRQPAFRHCDINLKRQCVWAYWGVRDKLACRAAAIRRIGVMAVTQPGLFVSKAANRLIPTTWRPRTLSHKSQ